MSTVAPAEGVTETLMVEWSADWHATMHTVAQSVSMADSSFIVLARESDELYRIEHFSPSLVLISTMQLMLSEGEQRPMIYHNHGKTILITVKKLNDGARAVRMRTIDQESGAISVPTTLLRTGIEFDDWFRSVQSLDGSKLMVVGVSSSFELDLDTAEVEARTLSGIIIDIPSGTSTVATDTILSGENFEEYSFADVEVTNNGIGIRSELHLYENDVYKLHIFKVQGEVITTTSHQLSTSLELYSSDMKDRKGSLRPTSLVTSARNDGVLFGAANLWSKRAPGGAHAVSVRSSHEHYIF